MDALSGATEEDLERFIRGWLAEGIPYGFQEAPAVFEAARDTLAKALNVMPRDVLLVGSARIGYSLAGPKFGRAFGVRSDLDFAVISTRLFEHIRSDAERWIAAYRAGEEHPFHAGEIKYWPENEKVLSKNMPKGFVDTKKIPNRANYQWARRANGAVGRVAGSIAASMEAAPRAASLRVYREWKDLAAQCARTLRNSALTATASGLAGPRLQDSSNGRR